MMRVSLVGMVWLVTIWPALGADSTKLASPASRVMAVENAPIVSRTMSITIPTFHEHSDVALPVAAPAEGKPSLP
jgi:hypothetical protein